MHRVGTSILVFIRYSSGTFFYCLTKSLRSSLLSHRTVRSGHPTTCHLDFRMIRAKTPLITASILVIASSPNDTLVEPSRDKSIANLFWYDKQGGLTLAVYTTTVVVASSADGLIART